MTKPRILLGQITGAHGIRGEVLVRSFTGDPDAIGGYGPLWTSERDGPGVRQLAIKVVRVTPKGAVVARIKGIADRNGAEALGKVDLWIERDLLPAPEEDEFDHEDLVGLAAHGVDGARIGTVIALQNFGAGDLLEVRLEGSTKTEFYPFTKACVPEIDLPARRLTIAPPPDAEPGPNDTDEPD
jgi:16S rRNA processing protein RimM